MLRRFRKNEEGSIAIETALLMLILGTMSLGILDFGLAYTRGMQLANAVRAGMQYALVRKPVDEDYSAIIAAVQSAAPDVGEDAGRTITAAMVCQCPDGSSIDCTGEGGVDLTCDDGNLRAAYLEITLTEQYSLLFDYPGIDQVVNFSRSTKVRLN